MGAIAQLFGGGKKKESPAPPPVPVPSVKPDEPESAAKKIARAALIETSPLGDLSPANTGRKKLLGN